MESTNVVLMKFLGKEKMHRTNFPSSKNGKKIQGVLSDVYIFWAACCFRFYGSNAMETKIVFLISTVKKIPSIFIFLIFWVSYME